MAGRFLCFSSVVVAIFSGVLWLGYVICLLALTGPVLEKFSVIENSPNFSKDLHAQIPQVSDVDYLLKWTKEFAALIFLPQYLVVMAYILSLSSALLDIHCSGRVRMQFITAAFTSVSSIVYLLTCGAAVMCVIVLLSTMYFLQHLVSDMISTLNKFQIEDDGLNSTSTGISKAISLLIGELFFLIAMSVVYTIYLCYWPHSLRMQNKKSSSREFVSNIDPDDSNDDL